MRTSPGSGVAPEDNTGVLNRTRNAGDTVLPAGAVSEGAELTGQEQRHEPVTSSKTQVGARGVPTVAGGTGAVSQRGVTTPVPASMAR
jgi:hypothetical protein